MRQSVVLALVATLASVEQVAARSLPRGVSPEFAKYYGSKDSFACISNPSIKISSKQVNDNSCDCPDGSDEPGTSACSYIDPLSPVQPMPGSMSGSTNATNALPGFWCANEGHIGAYVPFTFVNDGVCDYEICCDGSEEYSGVGGVKCPNKCAEIGKEFRRVAEQKRKSLAQARVERDNLVRQAKQARRNVENQIHNLRVEIASLEAKKIGLQKKFDEVERLERRKVAKGGASTGKLAELLDLSKNRVEELRDTLDIVVEQRDALRGKISELEGILSRFKEEYNPNYNDEGVKAAVKSWEDFAAKKASEPAEIISDAEVRDVLVEDGEANGINWKDYEGLEDDATDTDILYALEAYLPKFVLDLYYKQAELVKKWLVSNGILADKQTRPKESRALISAREALQTVEREITSKSNTFKSEEEDLAKDYGPDEVFRALKGKCVTTDSGEYTYELCWFAKTMQKSKKGHGNTSMGDFARIDREMADEEERVDGKGLGKGERMVLRYENGQSCWNGPRRRTDVWLACAEKEELWKVSESEKCVYKMEVGTPAACDPDPAVAGSSEKDEL